MPPMRRSVTAQATAAATSRAATRSPRALRPARVSESAAVVIVCGWDAGEPPSEVRAAAPALGSGPSGRCSFRHLTGELECRGLAVVRLVVAQPERVRAPTPLADHEFRSEAERRV